MSWSLGETSALALKATRGAGLSWGLAEEAAGAVAWLHERGLPGTAALCSYLSTIADAASLHGSRDAACPLLTGSALSDGTIAAPSDASETLDLGRVLSPLLLLPFVASLPPGTMWLCGKIRAGGRTATRPLAEPVASWGSRLSCHERQNPADRPGRRAPHAHARTVWLLYRKTDAFRPPHLRTRNQRVAPFRGRCRPYRQ